jgi:hypothetical protein
MLRRSCYATGGRPVDAAIRFMLGQVTGLPREARHSAFARSVLATVARLLPQMSAEARALLPRWLAEFELPRDADAARS